MNRFTLILLTVAAAGSLAGCAPSKSETAAPPEAAATAKKTCEGDAGIAVPAGFCASIFASAAIVTRCARVWANATNSPS